MNPDSLAKAIAAKSAKAMMFIITIVAPVGVSNSYEASIPAKKHVSDTQAEHIVTLLKHLHNRIEVSAGNIIRLEIKSAPIMRIPSTIVIAVKNASSML